MAASAGHFKVVEWLKENGCLLYEYERRELEGKYKIVI